MIDFEKEIEKAEGGDGMAAYIVGRAFLFGENGATKDEQKGYDWHERGSKMRNNALNLYGLGVCYSRGIIVNKDESKAVEFFEQALPEIERMANEGEKHSMRCMVYYYMYGNAGVPKDKQKSKEWQEKFQAAVRAARTVNVSIVGRYSAAIIEFLEKTKYPGQKVYISGGVGGAHDISWIESASQNIIKLKPIDEGLRKELLRYALEEAKNSGWGNLEVDFDFFN